MKISTRAIIFIALLLAIAFYYLGKRNGGAQVKTTVIQNAAFIKQIAELGALNVGGTATIKESNKEDNAGMYAELKNYFIEKTININIPYEAKYGVELNQQSIQIDTKAKQVKIYLPSVKLLSFQLHLNNIEAIGKTGWFNNLSLDDFVKVEKILYTSTLKSLEQNAAHKKLAEEHIRKLLQKYYDPMGLTVQCVFAESNKPVAP